MRIGFAVAILCLGAGFALTQNHKGADQTRHSVVPPSTTPTKGEKKISSPIKDTSEEPKNDTSFKSESVLGQPDGPKIKIQEPQTQGGIDNEEVSALLALHHDQVMGCYQEVLAQSAAFETEMVVSVTLVAAGTLGEVAATMSEPHDALRKCVLAEINQIEFPKPEGSFGSVSLKLEFVPAPPEQE